MATTRRNNQDASKCFTRLAIRKKLYGDPVYKQNVADIRDRNRRLKQGQECSLMKISVLSSAGRQDPGRDIPEYYVDKDRNIPVTDTKDIKGNLLRRQYQRKNRDLYHSFCVSQTKYHIKRRDFQTGAKYAKQGLRVCDESFQGMETHLSLLLGQCCLYSGDFVKSMEITLALTNRNVEDENNTCLLVLAESLYQMDDYEHALVFYFRGLNKTIKAKKAFQTGIRMCTKAIMNAINESSLAWSENHILQQLLRK